MGKILVIQHADSEGLGRFEDEMKLAGDTPHIVKLHRSEKVPPTESLKEWSGVVIMGGPQSAVPAKLDGFLKEEVAFVAEGIRQKKPMIGVCLGAQIIARAAGARLWQGEKKEIGWYPVFLDKYICGRSPLLGSVADRFMAFQYHGDSFDVPTQGYLMAYGENYRSQLICTQGVQYGIQFHVEVTEEMIAQWLLEYQPDASIAPPVQTREVILAQSKEFLPYLHKVCHKIWYGFHSLLK